MPITYPLDINVDSFTDALTVDSPDRQHQLRKARRRAQRARSDSNSRNTVSIRRCGVRQVWLEIGGNRSHSYSPTRTKPDRNYVWDRAHPTINGARFHFVPGDPEQVALGTNGEVCIIKYDLHKPTRIRAAKLELFRTKDADPLLSVDLDYNAAQARLEPRVPNGPVRLQGNDLVWDGRLGRTASRVAGKVIDINSSPYKLKLSVEPLDGVGLELGEAWTYFDVLVHTLKIEWGDDLVIPGNRADVDPRFQADVRAYEVAMLQDLKLNASPGANVVDTADHRLPLTSNLFTTDLLGQSGTDAGFRCYREMWGDGPLIPLYVVAELERSNGTFVSTRTTPWVLGATQFLWDWEDDPGTKSAQWAAAPQRTRDYLDHAYDYLVQIEADDREAPDGSNNCHVHHGGKRGRGGRPVFPAQNPVNYGPATAALLANEFPFEVTPTDRRRWAAKSTPRKTGVLAGLSGVMFQPSRIAGDRYRVAVYLTRRKRFWWTKTGAQLRAAAIPHAATGVLTIWRRVNARVYRADGTVGNVNAATITGVFEEARIELDMPAAATVNTATWQGAFYTGMTDYLDTVIQPRPWLGAMLAVDQAGPDCMQFADPAGAAAHLTALANTGLWEVTVTGPGLTDHTLQPGEPVEHPGTHTRGHVLAREQVAGQYRIHVDHALGQHLAPGPNLTILRGPIALNIVACQRMNAPLDVTTVDGRLQALLAPAPAPDLYRNISKNSSIRLMREYVNAAHAGAKGVFFFLFKQMATHGGEPRAGGTNSSVSTETLAFAYLQDDPTIPPVGAGPLKAFDLVTAHELGHALFLPHAPHERDSKPRVHIEVPNNENDNCIMNYHATSAHLCGLCMLRLMGWSIHGNTEVANNDPQLIDLSNQDRNKRTFQMQSLTATVPATPPKTVRKLHNSTTLNLPPRATVNGQASADIVANAPIVLLTDSAGPAPAPALADAQRQAICGPLRLEARARMDPGARYVWRIERVGDDDARVVAASPNPLPTTHTSGANNEIFEVESNATGSFHIKASVDVNGGANFDPQAESFCINLVLVKIERIESDHTFKKDHGGCWFNHGDISIGTQRAGKSIPVEFKTKINLIGGGPNGRRGLDKVSGGWINNIRSDSTGAHYTANDGSGNVWSGHAPALHRDAPGAAWARIAPAISNAAPIVDKKSLIQDMSNWSARHSVLSGANPGPNVNLDSVLVAKQVGGHCWIYNCDAPANGWDVHPPTLAQFDIDRIWLRTRFTAYLCFWTHSAPCLVGVLEEIPWEIAGEYQVDTTGPVRHVDKMRVTMQPKTKHATIVSAVNTNLEWCPPGSIECTFQPRHFPPAEDPTTDLGFRWDDPTSR